MRAPFERLRVNGNGAETCWLFRSEESGLAPNALVRERFYKALGADVSVPEPRKLPVLLVEVGNEDVIRPLDIAAILLYSHVIVAPVVGR